MLSLFLQGPRWDRLALASFGDLHVDANKDRPVLHGLNQFPVRNLIVKHLVGRYVVAFVPETFNLALRETAGLEATVMIPHTATCVTAGLGLVVVLPHTIISLVVRRSPIRITPRLDKANKDRPTLHDLNQFPVWNLIVKQFPVWNLLKRV